MNIWNGLDEQSKRGVFAACALMIMFLLLALLVKWVGWILLICFALVFFYSGYKLFVEKWVKKV